MDKVRRLPLYEMFACGAPMPPDGQYQVKWYVHLSKVDILVSLVEGLFYLKRSAPRQGAYFNVVGELRRAPADLTLHDIVTDPCEPHRALPAWADPRSIARLPVCAEVVVHKKDQPSWHIRDRALWERLTVDQRRETSKREQTLLAAPVQVASFCLGADALLVVHRFTEVLCAFAKMHDLAPDHREQATSLLQKHLARAGVTTGLLAATEWLFLHMAGRTRLTDLDLRSGKWRTRMRAGEPSAAV